MAAGFWAMRIGDTASLWMMGAMAVATLGGVMLTSMAKKDAVAFRDSQPSFEERLDALDAKKRS